MKLSEGTVHASDFAVKEFRQIMLRMPCAMVFLSAGAKCWGDTRSMICQTNAISKDHFLDVAYNNFSACEVVAGNQGFL